MKNVTDAEKICNMGKKNKLVIKMLMFVTSNEKDTARPRIAVGNISVDKIHMTGPKPKLYPVVVRKHPHMNSTGDLLRPTSGEKPTARISMPHPITPQLTSSSSLRPCRSTYSIITIGNLHEDENVNEHITLVYI